MKISIVAPITLSLLAITLAGCDEEGIYNSGGSSSNEFTVSSFEGNSNAVARIDRSYSTGEREVNIINIVGSYNAQNIDDLDNATVLADNFEGLLEDKYIEVNGRTVKRPVYKKNSSNRFNYETTYRTLSLTGVDARDYNTSTRRGILTDLNNYTVIPNNVRFPSGSVCYVPVVSSDRSFFTFNTNNKTRYETLDKWTKNAEERFSDNRQSSTTKLNIGSSNQRKAVQVKFFAINNDPEYLYNGIDYNNNNDEGIYEADFISSNSTAPNEDSVRGFIDCTLVNDVAADFLEREIKRYY